MALTAVHNETTFSVGDLVLVHTKLFEGGKMRITPFEGTVIAIKGPADTGTFTVRRVGAGRIGIERIFPLASPWITKIEVRKKATNLRRAKLYYLREKPPSAYGELTRGKVVPVRRAQGKQLAKVEKTRKHVKRKSRKAGRRGSSKATSEARV